MEIALNKESKRKTPVAVAFRDGERTFGEDAITVGVRFPKNCYTYLLDLIGKKIDNPMVRLYQKRFPYYNIVPDSKRGTVIFQHDDETQYTVEELLGMILYKAKEIAQNSAGQVINEMVLTVPGFFNQAERKALIQAAELAGMKVLQLINDYTAVALNYGIFRRKDFNETAQYIMFYDMGASSTTATIVSYQVVKTKERGMVEVNPQLSVIGVGYDRTLGGLEMQLRLRDYLGKKFNEMGKTKNDVFKNPRALAKLFKEAGRLKNVLSANLDHYAQVEGLLDEIDFKLQITRGEFESLCSDLFERVKDPMLQALKSSGLTIDVISQVILVGAGTRVPAVQNKLEAIIGSELGKNLNTDEAAVLGSVYKAADLSTGFKVKKFITKDAVLFPIQVTFEREIETGSRQVKRMLFGPMNPYPQKKILTFNKHQADFDFSIGYSDLNLSKEEIESIGALNLTRVSLSGVSEAIKKHQGPNVESKGIKAHFSMDDSGILELINVELVVEKNVTEGEITADEESPLSKLGSTISKLFSGEFNIHIVGPEETLKENIVDKPGPEEEKEDGTDRDKKEGTTSDSNKTKEDVEKEDAKKPEESKPKVILIREEIVAKEETLTVSALKDNQLEDVIKKIEELNQFDEDKSRREGALNALESYVFEAKRKLESDEYKFAATQGEANAIIDMCKKLSDWLDEDGWSSDTVTLENKLTELKKLTQPVWWRVKEHQDRPEALAALESTLNRSSTFLVTIKNMSAQYQEPGDSVFTQVEIDTLSKVIDEIKDWREKIVVEQSKLLPSDPPKLTIKLIMEKVAQLEREVRLN
ncbi:hypothetical protein AAG570_011485 [Ranatra chinensis]|uniref:Hypoxia up-regulated protein 1 n=1 Tax=Ranatra chinensis TaxID=642074 RepID=A0ABD0YL01_9HEMI